MKLENVLNFVNAIIAILPLVEKVVELVEHNFTTSGDPGSAPETKKAAAMQILGTSGQTVGLDNAAMSEMIDSVVAIKNASGQFKHPEKPEPKGNNNGEKDRGGPPQDQ